MKSCVEAIRPFASMGKSGIMMENTKEKRVVSRIGYFLGFTVSASFSFSSNCCIIMHFQVVQSRVPRVRSSPYPSQVNRRDGILSEESCDLIKSATFLSIPLSW